MVSWQENSMRNLTIFLFMDFVIFDCCSFSMQTISFRVKSSSFMFFRLCRFGLLLLLFFAIHCNYLKAFPTKWIDPYSGLSYIYYNSCDIFISPIQFIILLNFFFPVSSLSCLHIRYRRRLMRPIQRFYSVLSFSPFFKSVNAFRFNFYKYPYQFKVHFHGNFESCALCTWIPIAASDWIHEKTLLSLWNWRQLEK